MSWSTTPVTVFEAITAYVAEAPKYHIALEAVLLAWVLYLLFFSKQYRPASKHDKLTKKEEDELIAEWTPEPLVPADSPGGKEVDPSPIVSGTAGPHMTVNGKKCLNLATFNFLSLLGKQSIKDVAANSVTKYGVGACGPRGFYGTVDVHLELEERLAKFTGREEAVLYSYGFAAISSAIPAYSKRRDIIFCDEGVCFPLQKGLIASRSKIKYFRHNDMTHLEQLLEEQHKQDLKNPAKAKVTRHFIVAEAVYMNWGDLAPLPKLVELRKKYRVPIFLEESLSFGVLGKTGRGATEYFNISPDDVDIVCVSLDMAVASVGGFCAGKSYIIDHQRLSGLGYCFSASVPPMLAAAAVEALNIMEQEGEEEDGGMFQVVQEKGKRIKELLAGIEGIEVFGEDLCPMKHLRLSRPSASREDDEQLLQRIADDCLSNGVAVTMAKYLPEEILLPPPSIRLTVCTEHTEEELTAAAAVIKEAVHRNIQTYVAPDNNV